MLIVDTNVLVDVLGTIPVSGISIGDLRAEAQVHDSPSTPSRRLSLAFATVEALDKSSTRCD
jgi:hypothetical protein